MNKTLQDLRHFFETRRDEIINEWYKRRSKQLELAGSKQLPREIFIDHLPEILDGILQYPQIEEDSEAASPLHGYFRFSQKYDLKETINDLHTLQEILLELVTKAYSESSNKFGATEMLVASRIVSRYFNDCTANCSQTFLDLQNAKDQQIEERLRSRIDNLSGKLSESLTLLGSSTHDLKSSTDVLVQLADVAREREDDPFLRALSQGLVYNQSILADLQILTKIGTNRFEHSPESFDIKPLVESIWDRLSFVVESNTRQVEWESNDSLNVELDRLSIERIVSNLIDNAISHGNEDPTNLSWGILENNKWYFQIQNGLSTTPSLNTTDNDKPESSTWQIDSNNHRFGLSVISTLVQKMSGTFHHEIIDGKRFSAIVKLPRTLAADSKTSQDQAKRSAS